MLGEVIVDGQGKLTTQRVLPSDGPLLKLEVTFELLGTILGRPAKTFVTYWSAVQPDGSLYGECPSQGVVMTEDGESATFRAAGAGNFTGPGGAVAYRGAIYYQTTVESLAALNGLAIVYEWDVDAEGNATFKGWEWK